MEQTFAKKGLPIELTRLPFVESLFQWHARSSAAAGGIWQFMPGTARQLDRQTLLGEGLLHGVHVITGTLDGFGEAVAQACLGAQPADGLLVLAAVARDLLEELFDPRLVGGVGLGGAARGQVIQDRAVLFPRFAQVLAAGALLAGLGNRMGVEVAEIEGGIDHVQMALVVEQHDVVVIAGIDLEPEIDRALKLGGHREKGAVEPFRRRSGLRRRGRRSVAVDRRGVGRPGGRLRRNGGRWGGPREERGQRAGDPGRDA
ncbi:MAG: transglycosylase SLT domain-containing protein [Acidobacteriota bacterium]